MDFNRDVAQWVYGLVAKMDDGEAQLFTVMLADDLYQADVKNNARLIERTHNAVTKAMTDELADDFLYRLEHGEDPEQLVAEAAAVSIAKAEKKWENTWYKNQARTKGGQFGHMTGGQYRAQKKIIRGERKLDEANLKAINRYRKKQGMSGKIENKGDLDRDLQTSFYGQKLDSAHQVGAAVQDYEGHWNQKTSGQSGATDTFNRMKATGDLAGNVGFVTGNPKLMAAGAAASIVGQFGPEAEKVVGPSVRRTAYRYRGTERTPDAKLKALTEGEAAQINRVEGKSKGQGTHVDALTPAQKVHATEQAAMRYFLGTYRDGDEKAKSRVPDAKRADLQRKSGRVTPSEGILISPDGKIAAQAVGYAEDHYLPFNLKNLGGLQGGSYVRTRESGGLTSEDIYTGLMSGARSMTVVSNSGTFTVDFADDLRGGRRFNDKAKQMVGRYEQTLDAVKSEQVANPDRMLSPDQRADIKLEVDDRLEEQGLAEYTTKDEREKLYQDAIKEHMAKPAVPPEVEKEIRRRADSEPDDRSRKRAYTAMYDEALNNVSGRNYRLDGEGYGAALDALQEQFPYYIERVHYQAKTAKGANRGELADRFNNKVDQGYVKPNYNRPEGAKTGYYDDSITGRGKGTADKTNYQNWRVNRTGGTSSTGTGSAGTAGGGAEDEGTKRNDTGSVDTRIRDKQQRINETLEADKKNLALKEAARGDADYWLTVHDELKADRQGRQLDPTEFPTLFEYNADRDAVIDDPAKVKRLAEETQKLKKTKYNLIDPSNQPDIPDRVGNLTKVEQKWDDKKLSGETPPPKPMSIEHDAAIKIRQKPEYASLLGKTEDELLDRSRQQRVLRRKAELSGDSDGVAKREKAIRMTEEARAVVANPVMSTEAYDAATKTTPATTPATTVRETKRISSHQEEESARHERNKAQVERLNQVGVRMQRAEKIGGAAADPFAARDLREELEDGIEDLEATHEEKNRLRKVWGLEEKPE